MTDAQRVRLAVLVCLTRLTLKHDILARNNLSHEEARSVALAIRRDAYRLVGELGEILGVEDTYPVPAIPAAKLVDWWEHG